jgi:hypothetical protein
VEDKPTDQSPASPPVHRLDAESLSTSAPELGVPALGKVLSGESLITKPFEIVEPTPPVHLKAATSSPPKQVRRKYRQEPVLSVLKKRWPDGVPPESELSIPDYLDAAIKAFKNDPDIKKLGLPIPGRKTFLRARKSWTAGQLAIGQNN